MGDSKVSAPSFYSGRSTRRFLIAIHLEIRTATFVFWENFENFRPIRLRWGNDNRRYHAIFLHPPLPPEQ